MVKKDLSTSEKDFKFNRLKTARQRMRQQE